MLKKIVTLSVLLLVIVGVSFAQVKNVKVYSKKIAPEVVSTQPGVNDVVNFAGKVFNPTVGDTVAMTNYDNFTNSIVRQTIVTIDGQPHFANMVRQSGGTRNVMYTYKTGDTYTQVNVFGGAAGWCDIDAQLTGTAVGTIGIVAHTPSKLAIWDGSSAFIVSQPFDPSTDPSLKFSGDNIFLATSGDRTEFSFYKTADYGVSFTSVGTISQYHPSPIFWLANGGVEVGMAKSPNEQWLLMYGTNTNSGEVYNGVSEDSADQIWALISSDAGATWTGKRIASDGVVGLVEGNPDLAPIFENFGQLDAAIDNNGNYHFMANGYSTLLDAARTSGVDAFTMLYYSSVTNKWKALIPVETDSLLAAYRNGNGIGFSYPSISISEDGNTLYGQWTGPQYTNSKLDTAEGHFFTDIYHTYSNDGGNSWAPVSVVAGKKDAAENFSNAAQFLTDDGATYTAHMEYIEDHHIGVFVFGEGADAMEPLVYKTFSVPKVVGVNENITVNNFDLQQNYPNPFNPSTLIKFSLAERSNVTLKVYDMLGREVATLMNGVQEAGNHQVTFDASQLSTGMYVYTINAGSFNASKKMMLLK